MRAELARPIAPLAVASEEDAGFVERFRAGDARAFDELVRKYQRAIYGLALRYVKDADDAKDVAQRAFVRAFQAIGGFRAGASFKTWLYRIAINLALNHLRDRKVKVSVDEHRSLAVDAVGTVRLQDAEMQAKLRAAVEKLPAKQRLVLELRVYEELPFREVAEIARCSENAAKVNYHHAVNALREHMEGALSETKD